MTNILKHQYDLIRASRQNVFAFFEEIPLEKLHEKVHGFGIDNMIEAHIHAANSYRYWIESFATKQDPAEFSDISTEVIKRADVQKDREIFDSVDEAVYHFLDTYQASWLEEIEHEVDWQDTPLRLTPLFLYSHTTTHEIHHKGQIVAMARHLGFNAPKDERLGSLFA
ncbi:MAG TPA: DinB family protein [Bacillales bacterium]|nr:DinB family protein [Bacillales bacterium]